MRNGWLIGSASASEIVGRLPWTTAATPSALPDIAAELATLHSLLPAGVDVVGICGPAEQALEWWSNASSELGPACAVSGGNGPVVALGGAAAEFKLYQQSSDTQALAEATYSEVDLQTAWGDERLTLNLKVPVVWDIVLNGPLLGGLSDQQARLAAQLQAHNACLFAPLSRCLVRLADGSSSSGGDDGAQTVTVATLAAAASAAASATSPSKSKKGGKKKGGGKKGGGGGGGDGEAPSTAGAADELPIVLDFVSRTQPSAASSAAAPTIGYEKNGKAADTVRVSEDAATATETEAAW